MDAKHLHQIRQRPDVFAPGGALHLVHEVVAYAADEAASTGTGARCTVRLHANGSVSVSDDGRGTDTRRDSDGLRVKKPVMGTKDLRFFDHPSAETLSDGHPRRGMSVVAALSDWLVHENRRLDGAWQQQYERGVPVTGLDPMTHDGTTARRAPSASSQEAAWRRSGLGLQRALLTRQRQLLPWTWCSSTFGKCR